MDVIDTDMFLRMKSIQFWQICLAVTSCFLGPPPISLSALPSPT
jgi:hypothetical protein